MTKAKNSRDVSISSLLYSSDKKEQRATHESADSDNLTAGNEDFERKNNDSLQSLIAQFRTNIIIPGIEISETKVHLEAGASDQTSANQKASLNTSSSGKIGKTFDINTNRRPSPPNKAVIEKVKQFQTQFEIPLSSDASSKPSINSLMNNEAGQSAGQKPPNKKKRPIKRKQTGDESNENNKKPANEKLKKPQPVPVEASGSPTVDGESKKKPARRAGTPKPPTERKSQKSPKKADQTPNSERKVGNELSTTEKRIPKKQNQLLPAPSIIEVNSPGASNNIIMKNKKSEANDVENLKAGSIGLPTSSKNNSNDLPLKDNEENDEVSKRKPEQPIIALNIPLLDHSNPKPGQAEVVINVLKLSEDKYGVSVIHPEARSAIELIDDILDDEYDGGDEDVEEEDDAPVEESNPSNNSSKKKKEAGELTEEELLRKHEAKMNRKVGKYDYEDPFIDDEELQWEEEITSTKDGFFVYWGLLVDDRSPITTKKAGLKGKK